MKGKYYRIQPKLSEFISLVTSVFEVAFWDDKENKEVTKIAKKVIKNFTFTKWFVLFW